MRIVAALVGLALTSGCIGSTDDPTVAPATFAPTSQHSSGGRSGVDAAVVGGSGGRADGAAPNVPDAPAAAASIGPAGLLAILPDRRTFTDTMDVELRAADPSAKVTYTLDDNPPTATSTPYAGPIRLTTSTVIRALVHVPSTGEMRVVNQAFVKLAADAAAFTSNLPVLLVHSMRARPTLKLNGVIPAALLVFTPDPVTGRTTLTQAPAVDTRTGIKVRGSSSEGFGKKQYKIETWDGPADEDAPKPMLGLPAESDWVINSGFFFDRAYVRNAFIYALSNKIGSYAPRTRFVEVLFTQNGLAATYAADYLGVYTLMEKPKVDKNRVAVATLKPTDNTEPAITGGYLFKVDRLNVGEVGFSAGSGPRGVWSHWCVRPKIGHCDQTRFAFEDPGETLLTAEQKKYLTGALDAFGNALANKQDYSSLIDVPSFIDHHILNTLTKNPDMLRLSGFFHKARSGKIFAGPIWDFDRTMGCAEDVRALNPTFWDPTHEGIGEATNSFDFGWYRGLFDDPAFKTAYFARLKELMAGPLSVAELTKLVDQLAVQLGKEAPERDAKKWGAGAAPRGGTIAAEMTRLQDWLKKRVEWMTTCLDLPDPETCRGI